jgi:dTDP-3-amino-2,3,6-trideoxy-4-keto-D-glucose/dTDP-3-amino-3,4,6-trideoxy-alpha-D-glucose/dTDP-2,6-dideoxy-D-kanosamine transaminase
MSNSQFVPLNDLARWDEADRINITRAIEDVVDSGYFINGPKTALLNTRFRKLLNDREIVFVGNGTDALTLALLGLGVREGDLVATVTNAGGYATGAILRIGAIPVLVDVDLRTAQISTDDLLKKMQRHPTMKALVVTHLYGQMADMQSVLSIARAFDCLVIEDCAQSIGAVQSGLAAGTFGDASTFSFYPTKNLSCLGDGGAISFKSKADADQTRQLAQYGWSSRYVIDHESGFNSRLDEIQAAVLLERIDGLQNNNDKRRLIVSQYRAAVKEPRYFIGEDDSSFIGHLAVLVTDSRDHDLSRFSNAKIATGIHYPILDHHQGAWSSHFPNVTLPNSELLVKKIISLPCFPMLSEFEVERVCEALQSL